jgi:hypothetical protein
MRCGIGLSGLSGDWSFSGKGLPLLLRLVDVNVKRDYGAVQQKHVEPKR